MTDDSGQDRDLISAGVVALALIGVFVLCLDTSPTATWLFFSAVVLAAAYEYFRALTRAGCEPMSGIGMSAIAILLVGSFFFGEQALTPVMILTVLTTLGWCVVTARSSGATARAALTLLGVAWIGIAGAFGVLMLRSPHRAGLLLGTIIVVSGHDLGAYFFGRAVGRTPLTSISPNKTLEGLIGGMATSFTLAMGVGAILPPWGPWTARVVLGTIGALLAPVGDLAQSVVKRDLGLKDMGQALPGHGGALDRIDSILFALPAVYFLAKMHDYLS